MVVGSDDNEKEGSGDVAKIVGGVIMDLILVVIAPGLVPEKRINYSRENTVERKQSIIFRNYSS